MQIYKQILIKSSFNKNIKKSRMLFQKNIIKHRQILHKNNSIIYHSFQQYSLSVSFIKMVSYNHFYSLFQINYLRNSHFIYIFHFFNKLCFIFLKISLYLSWKHDIFLNNISYYLKLFKKIIKLQLYIFFTKIFRLNMTTKLVLILITILYCAHSTSFSISVTSSCTTTQNGICTAWSQTGTITENTASCFPGQIEVMTSNGFKKMADLRLGDEIKSYNSKNGNDQFSKVLLWLHRQPKTVQTYLKLKSQELEVSISKYHNIASDEKYHFSFAHEMEGKKFVSDLKDQVISSVEEVELEGIYAPLTTNNNFYINYNGHQILVHCIANLRNPESYETILGVIMNASSYFYENPVESDEAYFHPVAKALTKYAPILLEGF